MNYLGQTFSYLKKNFWLPTVAMIIPSVLACFLSTPYWEVSFVAAFDYKPYISAAATFRILFGDSWQYLWPVVLIAAFQVFAAALIMSTMDRHFRSGKFSLSHPWRMINNSVFPIAIGVIVMSIMSILWRLLLFGLIMLVQVSSNAMGLPEGVALAVISVIAVVLFVIHVIIITPMLFWAPIMFIYGYKFRDAAASSFKLISGKKIFFSLFMPMLLCAGIQLLVGFLQAHVAIAIVVNFVLFLFTNVYATVFTMLTFYEISGLDRRDIKPHQAVPLPAPVKKEQQKQPTEPERMPTESESTGVTPQKSPEPKKTKPKKQEKSGDPAKKQSATAKKPKKTQNEPTEKNRKAQGEEVNDGV